MSRRATMVVGAILFAAGGALLAFAGETVGVAWGTICGLAGLGLLGWGALRRPAT